MKEFIRSSKYVLCISLIGLVIACQSSTKMSIVGKEAASVFSSQGINKPIQESVKDQSKCKMILLHDIWQSNDVFGHFVSKLKEELAKLGIYNIEFLYPTFREDYRSSNMSLRGGIKGSFILGQVDQFREYIDKHHKSDEITYILGCGQGALVAGQALAYKKDHLKDLDDEKIRFISLNGWLRGVELVSTGKPQYRKSIYMLIKECKKIGGEGRGF